MLLRRQWLDGEDLGEASKAYDPPLDLPEAYEKQVAQSDHIADRLRREADRVANFASLRSQVDIQKDSLEEILQKENELENRRESLSVQWTEIWKPCLFQPLSPKEMLSWLN